jgi:uncharacterized membrane protein
MIGWFVLLVAGVVVYRLLLARIRGLEDTLTGQRRTIEDLARRLETVSRPEPSAAPPQPATAPPRPITTPAITRPTQAADAPRVEKPKVVTPPPVIHAPPPVLREPALITAPGRRSDPGREGGPPPPLPPPPPATPRVPFDWENVIGVKLFSAIAGIALVLAAVFFLRYSIDRGWLSPPVRMAIGIIVAIALLVVCELKAARKYAVTANALDAAAIAILFATFFAAHSLWNLIPAVATFVLLALVTVVAVLLSIRRDSIFIAVLGLVGGFATPALLSTGENRPIPLFTYLLLLNVGLAWVASRRKWPLLTILSIVLTALYQWGWVLRFLTGSQLSLAMGIFLIFSVASFFALSFRARSDNTAMETTLDRGGLSASAMPLAFAVYLAAVPGYGAHAGLLFGFLFLIDAAMLAIGLSGTEVARAGNLRPQLHLAGAGATLLVFAIWLAMSYARGAWTTAITFVALFVAFYLLAPLIAARVRRPFGPVAIRSTYAAPLLLFVFPVIAAIEPAVAAPGLLFGTMFVLLALIAWRALAAPDSLLYFIAAFFAVAAEATWSATFLSTDTLGRGIALYVAFGVFYLGVPMLARRVGRRLEPVWGAGAVLIASLALLLFVATGLHSAAALWGLALLLAILDAGLFLESASAGLPALSAAGGMLSWVVLAVWWGESAAAVGLLPSLLVVTGLTLLMLGGHAWASRAVSTPTWRPPSGGPEVRLKPDATGGETGFRQGVYLAFVGHFFLFFIAVNPEWSAPPWPMLGALTVMTLATSAASLAARAPALHATGVIAAALVTLGWAFASAGDDWSKVALVTIEAVLAYGLAWLAIARRAHGDAKAAATGLTASAFIAQFVCLGLIAASATLPLAAVTAVLVVNAALTLALAWRHRWDLVAPAAVLPAWLATMMWLIRHAERQAWIGGLLLAGALYATFASYPFVLHRRAKDTRAPYLTAVLASALFFIAAYAALDQGGRLALVGLIPVVEGAVLALLMRQLLALQPAGERDLGRLATVAGAALAFATVAIPLQLRNQWITIGWALEGAALSWLYRRIPHRGLLFSASALLAAVFVRLALNPSIFVYEPRGMRIVNWYLYTYLLSAIAMFLAAWWLAGTDDRLGKTMVRMAKLLPAAGGILLFLLLNIEIADFYSTGREIMFRFGVTLAQDLTYTIGWLIFGLGMLMAGIYLKSRAGRVAAVALIAVTTCKAFLYDMGSLGGLYRVGALVGLAISLSLVALALQKFVLQAPKEA